MEALWRYRIAAVLAIALLAVPALSALTAYGVTIDASVEGNSAGLAPAKLPVRLGGPSALAVLQAARGTYDPAAFSAAIMANVDGDGDFIEDDLEEMIASLQPDEPVKVIVTFAGRPAAFGTPAKLIISNLERAMSIAESLGGKVYAGPWKNALIGFAVELPAGSVAKLAQLLQGFDADGDGSPDRVLLAPDREFRALNYWSGKQVGVRPYVWYDLNVRGYNVTVVVIDTGIDDAVSAFPGDYGQADAKIVYWADYTGDPSGQTRDYPYDDNLHGTHVAGTVAGVYSAMDDQGRVVLNFGLSDLDTSNWPTGTWLRFGYPYMGYFVNATGTIEFNFIWKGDTTATSTTGTISRVGIGYCGWVFYSECSNYQVVAYVDTPNENTWYTVTYDVTSPDQFGFYFLVFEIGTGGGLAFLPIMKFPVDTTYDGDVPHMSGMAPEAKLGGAKVLSFYGGGSTTDIASAIDDVVGNRTLVNPHLYIISMSLGGGYDSTLDQAVSNAAAAGVLPVVAAGNDGAGTGTAATGSPASNPYAITVAALDAMNNITDYSSDGGQSQTDSSVIKPDVAAPGGGEYMQIYSADTTWHDDLMNAVQSGFGFFARYVEDIDWSDTINVTNTGYDDALGISGTSMATPHVSGIAALVVSALTVNASIAWDWNSYATAGLVKNIILMTAYETYPLYREPDNVSYSPTLDKGGKDIHEGYGAVEARAAVIVALSMGEGKALLPGSVVSEWFRNGTAYNADFDQGVWQYPFGPSTWGSRVYFPLTTFKLYNGTSYTVKYGFALYADTPDPSNTDFDLYLYSVTPNNYGEPVILNSSVAGMGTTVETFTFTPADAGVDQAIVVAKRAREDSAGGYWFLSIGPYARAEGQNPNDNAYYEGQAWIGWPLRIYAMSALKASQVYIEIYDNTTGTVLNSTTLTMTDVGAYTEATYEWIVPFDSNLVGHNLVVITKFLDANGNEVSGPYAATVVVNDAPAPVPEPGMLAALAALAALSALLLLRRRAAA